MIIDCKNLDPKIVIEKIIVNPDYFRCLVETYEKPMHSYLSRLMGYQKEDIEDVIQESFIRIYKNLREFDPELPLENWVYRITYHTFVDVYRKTKRHYQNRSYHSELADMELSINHQYLKEDLSKEFENREEVRKIIGIINSLDDHYRDVAILRFYENKSYQEMSDILRQPIGTISSKVKRIKTQIFGDLQEEGP